MTLHTSTRIPDDDSYGALVGKAVLCLCLLRMDDHLRHRLPPERFGGMGAERN
jgi:hypothetical protein